MRSWRCWTDAAVVAALLAGAPIPLIAQTGVLPATGLGTLRQDAIAVRLSADNLLIRVLPLDERVTRLLAPDTWQSLQALVDSRADAIAAAARSAGLDGATVILVTFFGMQPATRFSPDQLHIASQNRGFRPVAVVPLSPRWGDHLVDQRQQATAIYLFDPGIEVLRPLTISYGAVTSDAWTTSLRQLDAERQRVLARARPARP